MEKKKKSVLEKTKNAATIGVVALILVMMMVSVAPAPKLDQTLGILDYEPWPKEYPLNFTILGPGWNLVSMPSDQPMSPVNTTVTAHWLCDNEWDGAIGHFVPNGTNEWVTQVNNPISHQTFIHVIPMLNNFALMAGQAYWVYNTVGMNPAPPPPGPPGPPSEPWYVALLTAGWVYEDHEIRLSEGTFIGLYGTQSWEWRAHTALPVSHLAGHLFYWHNDTPYMGPVAISKYHSDGNGGYYVTWISAIPSINNFLLLDHMGLYMSGPGSDVELRYHCDYA